MEDESDENRAARHHQERALASSSFPGLTPLTLVKAHKTDGERNRLTMRAKRTTPIAHAAPRFPTRAARLAPLAILAYLALTGVLTIGIGSAAYAQSSAAVRVDIPAGPLTEALSRLARQAKVAITVDNEKIKALRTPGLKGRYPVEEGFHRLLQGSGYAMSKTAAGYALTPVAQPQPQAPIAHDSPALPSVKVTASSQPSSPAALPEPYAGGQVGRGARLGLLGNTDVMDAPFNITSYTAEVIENQGAGTVAAVLQNDPSVRFTTSEGHLYENFNIRGFDVHGDDVAFNGLYGLAPNGHVPTEFIERVEVLKGPGALLGGMSPQGSVGGIINLAPKRAEAAALTRLTADFTSSAHVGAHLDVSRRFGVEDRFGVRFNGVYRDGETGVDDQSKRRALGALALDYRGEQLQLSLDAYADEEHSENGSPWMATFLTGSVLSPPKTGTNLLRGIYGNLENSAVVLSGAYEFNDALSAFAAVGTHRYRYEGYINGTRAAVINAAGDYRGTTFHQRGGSDALSAETGLRTRFQTGPVGHQAVLSASVLDTETLRANPATSATYPSNIYDPVTPLLAADPGPAPKSGDADLTGVALADTLSFAEDKVLLTLGARHQRVRTKAYNVTTGAATSDYDESALTPALGAVVKPWGADLALYANYIEGLSQGDTVTDVNAQNFGHQFAPYQTEQIEFGVKWDLGHFANTFSLFQITRPSVIKNAVTNTYEDSGEQRNRGVEWNAFGQLTSNLRLLGGVAYTQGRLTQAANPDYSGNTPYGTPKWKANLGVEWDIPAAPEWTLSARAIHTGSQYVNSANTQQIPSWTRYDLGARYTAKLWGQGLVVRANLENVFDESYWAGSFSDGYVTQGAPRTFKLSAAIDF